MVAGPRNHHQLRSPVREIAGGVFAVLGELQDGDLAVSLERLLLVILRSQNLSSGPRSPPQHAQYRCSMSAIIALLLGLMIGRIAAAPEVSKRKVASGTS